MKNCGSVFGLFRMMRRLAIGAVVVFLTVVLPGCRHAPVTEHAKDARYQQLDSLLGRIGDVDSLAAVVRQSHEQNDAQSEMIALRYQGRLLRNQSRFDEAVVAHNAGLEVASALSDTVEMALALNNLGTNYRRIGDLSRANGYHYQALKLCDNFSGRDSDEMLKVRVATLNGIGNIEIELCNYAVADSVLRVALDGERRLERNLGMAINYSNLGSIKRSIGELDSAWVYQRKSLEYNQLAGSELGVALCHMHFGELHEDGRRFSHAIEEYELAYDQLKNLADNWHWLSSCLALARVNILLGEEEEAQRYLSEAEAEAERIGSKEYQAEASMLHYELSLLAGDSKDALEYYIKSTELYDSIHGLKTDEEMRAQRSDYERGRQSGEVDVLNRDINNLKRMRNMQLTFLVMLLIMSAAVIAALMYAMRVRARTQRLMCQVEETRSLFFTNVVHQLRSPLSAIMGAIDEMVTEDPSGQVTVSRENTEVIERQGKNLLTLVDRILQVGSVRSALTDPEWRTGDIVAFLRMVIESYREQCVNRHIELTYAPRESDVDIDIVPSYLNTIIGSLIENAINYSRDYGKIIVTSKVDGDKCTIRVADDGMGISKTDLPHVFEPFYRSAAAEQIVDGIGIGLTVVRDMTMAMGGTVAVDSMSGHGAVFTVTVPSKHVSGTKQRLEMKVEPVRDRVRNLLHRSHDTTTPTDPSDLPVVLVVEDHIDVARIVGRTLGKDYVVHYATDGEMGLAKAQDLVPDVIITDVKMPLMDGLELCRRVRRSPSVCDTPIIVLSARTSEADRIRGIEAGADVYMVKPFAKDELRIWVSHLLQRRRSLVETVTRHQQAVPVAISGQDDMATQQDDIRFLADFATEVDKQFANGSKLDFDKIAHKLKMGETQLRRRIQALTGKSVPAYVTQLRMEKAMRLLHNNPDCLIGDIADQCGFQDVAYFSRVFKQHYGMAPSQVRNSNK